MVRHPEIVTSGGVRRRKIFVSPRLSRRQNYSENPSLDYSLASTIITYPNAPQSDFKDTMAPHSQPFSLQVAPTKAEIASALLIPKLLDLSTNAIQQRGCFTIALSGGSLPSLLSGLKEIKEIDWSKWHVLLADERCVPLTSADSNLGALKQAFLDQVPIPATQVYGINESLIQVSPKAVAEEYESIVQQVLRKSGNSEKEEDRLMLDVAVLGFGPDGHTCSLFPNHALLKEDTKWVAGISDSPKAPPERITLTYPVLNQRTRHVLVVGAGASKQPIVGQTCLVCQTKAIKQKGYDEYACELASPAPFPVGRVYPKESLTWMIDQEALPESISDVATNSGTSSKY